MDIFQSSFVILFLSIAAYSSAFLLTTSSDSATTGMNFTFTCFNYPPKYDTLVHISRDNKLQCFAHMRYGEDCYIFKFNQNDSCFCDHGTITLTIPSFDIDVLHGTHWTCGDGSLTSESVLLYVKIPITNVDLTASPSDENPIQVVSGSNQRFTCTTDAGRPSARIQWYLSGTNITDEATAQPGICSSGCETVISSSVLLYVGDITDNGKIIYCTAVNVEGQSLNSSMKSIDILFPITKVNLTATPSDENPIQVVSGSNQRFTCTTDAGRPSARIQWYLSGTNITDEATAQPGICSSGCETVISSSVLLYVGDITDNGKIIYCTAVNVEGQSLNSSMKSIDILFPITKVYLTATPSDDNPIQVVSGSNQRFTCITDAGRPSARIQWYMSGTNITDKATAQPGICSSGCETLISYSDLLYVGNITDNGKTIYCTAVNVEGQSVNSSMKSIDILYEPLIAQIPDINITEGNTLAITCNVVSNPDPTLIWWTRQNEPGFIFNNTNLTISNIHRNVSDSYTCHAMNILTPSGMSQQIRTSQNMFEVNVQYEPLIAPIPDYNITEGNTLTLTCNVVGNPDPTLIWWTRQNEPGFSFIYRSLKISNIHRNDSDTYTCHAMNMLTPSGLSSQRRTSQKMFDVNVQYRPSVHIEPSYNPYILYEGQQNIELLCAIDDANPTVDITYNWTNLSAPISGKFLNITTVLRSVSGQYSCSAMNLIGTSDIIWKQLDVQYQPEISDIQDYNVTEGNNLIIFPIIHANPQPILFWWSHQKKPEVGHNSTYLKISNIQRQSSGYHTFLVRNILTPSGMPSQERTSKKMFHVNVQYQPLISDIQDHNVTEGNDLKIYPVIDANPQPSLLWWTSQNEPDFIYYGSNLTITNIQRNSSGNYTCHVMNILTPSVMSPQNRTSKKMIYVNVQYQSMIAEINDINITEGSSLAIYPVINANPQFTSVWWSRQGEPDFRYYDTNFTISNIQRKSSGTYIFHAMNILTPSGMPPQKRTSKKMCYVNVQYKPVLSGSSDYTIEEGSTLTLSPTIDANPSPTYIWWTRENDTSFIYNEIPLIINNIQQIDSGSYIVHVMNTLTPSGLPETNLTSQKVYNINVMLLTGPIAQDTSDTSDNYVITGAGIGAGVIFISIVVIGVVIFILRKRQINRRNENSNKSVYESTPKGQGQLPNREMHLYNDLENVKAEAKNMKKKTEESSYEEIGDVKSIKTDNIYQNWTPTDNESQRHYQEKILYENLHP